MTVGSGCWIADRGAKSAAEDACSEAHRRLSAGVRGAGTYARATVCKESLRAAFTDFPSRPACTALVPSFLCGFTFAASLPDGGARRLLGNSLSHRTVCRRGSRQHSMRRNRRRSSIPSSRQPLRPPRRPQRRKLPLRGAQRRRSGSPPWSGHSLSSQRRRWRRSRRWRGRMP